MIEFQGKTLADALKRIGQAAEQPSALAKAAEAEVLGHAQLGARRNIYDSAPGAYRRTGDLLRAMNVSSSASAGRATVTVGNTASYALAVELGNSPGISVAQDQALSAANRNPEAPISLGRSGRAFTVAGPFIGPAQAYGLYKMGQLFAAAVRRELR